MGYHRFRKQSAVCAVLNSPRNRESSTKTVVKDKMFALMIAVIMCMAMGVTAFAGTITVTNVKKGETYEAYKILEYSSNADKTAYSYYLETSNAKTAALKTILESAGFSFTESADGTRYVLDETTMSADDIVSALKDAGLTSSNVLAYASKTAAADGEAVFSDLDTGYWFVTTTTGSLCALATYDDEAIVVEKNTIPSVDKKEGTTEGTYTDGPVDANIGDTVYYQIVVTDGTGTNQKITLTDTMSAGLTYAAGSIKINGSEVADDADVANWKVTVSGQTITIELKASYVESLEASSTVTITYEATINENAVVDSATGNENKVELDYSAQHSEDKVYVETYDFTLSKTAGSVSGDALTGAQFKLYDAATGGNEIKVSQDSTGYYVDEDGTATITAGTGINVRGLAPGTYYLEETVAPAGYNLLDERQAVTITTGATAAVAITVVNNAGSVLPSTGGMGTTIFYVIGAILVIGAGVLLVTRRRMRAE